MTENVHGPWRKSGYSNGSGGNCVEVDASRGDIRVRDSKDPQGPVMVFTAAAWGAFLAEVRAGAL
jgi:hypothetical protein